MPGCCHCQSLCWGVKPVPSVAQHWLHCPRPGMRCVASRVRRRRGRDIRADWHHPAQSSPALRNILQPAASQQLSSQFKSHKQRLPRTLRVTSPAQYRLSILLTKLCRLLYHFFSLGEIRFSKKFTLKYWMLENKEKINTTFCEAYFLNCNHWS